jgi:soluble lytic murein transglycosylase-like protein
MPKYKAVRILVPDIKKSFVSGSYNYSTKSVKDANKKMIATISKNFGTYINKWGGIFEIPNGVVISFIATESGGRNASPNQYKATGLMQTTPNAVWECARKWKNEVSSDLPIEMRNLITSNIPDFFTSKNSVPTAAQQTKLLNLLMDYNFNIACGCMILRWLIERFSTFITGGQLNKAMVAYNAGAYTKALNIGTVANKVPIDSTSLSVNPRVPSESRGYLLKMLGINGFMQLFYVDKAAG